MILIGLMICSNIYSSFIDFPNIFFDQKLVIDID